MNEEWTPTPELRFVKKVKETLSYDGMDSEILTILQQKWQREDVTINKKYNKTIVLKEWRDVPLVE